MYPVLPLQRMFPKERCGEPVCNGRITVFRKDKPNEAENIAY